MPVDQETGLPVDITTDRLPEGTEVEPTEAPYLPTQYSIQNVKFVANVISLGQDFVNQLRQQVSESGKPGSSLHRVAALRSDVPGVRAESDYQHSGPLQEHQDDCDHDAPAVRRRSRR